MTIYVVIGLFILISSILLVSYRSGFLQSAWDKEHAKSLLIPEQAKKVQDFVTGCIQKTAEDGLMVLGSQGGYLAIPNDEFPASPANPFSNRLEVIDGLSTAYWVYQKPNTVERVQIPTLGEMENDLAIYMSEHLRECVQGFSDLPEYEIEENEVVAKAEILDEKVQFIVTYPLKIEEEDFSYGLTAFYVSVPVSLGRLYRLGKEIVESAQKESFLEEKTLDMLSLYEEIPFASTEVSCQPKIWKKEDVKEALKDALQANIPAVKIDSTEFNAEHDYFVWDAQASDASDLRASVIYLPSWPLKLLVEPSDEEILVSEPILPNNREELAFVSGLFCLQDYKFVYDIAYPVVFVLSDNIGYSLQFAYQVVIDNNQPRKNALALEDDFGANEKICDNLGKEIMVNVLSDEGGQLVSADGKVSVVCASTECPVGTSKNGKFIGRAPQCVNGKLVARKDGYHEGKAIVDTVNGGVMSVVMNKYTELAVDVQFLRDGFLQTPDASAEYFVIFSEQDKGYSVVVNKDVSSIKLIPGSYDIKGYVLLHSDVGFTIEGKSIEKCVDVPRSDVLGFLGVKEEKCVNADVPSTEITDVVAGGMEIGWNVASEDLADASELKIILPIYKIPSTFEEMSDIFGEIQTSVNAVNPELT